MLSFRDCFVSLWLLCVTMVSLIVSDSFNFNSLSVLLVFLYHCGNCVCHSFEIVFVCGHLGSFCDCFTLFVTFYATVAIVTLAVTFLCLGVSFVSFWLLCITVVITCVTVFVIVFASLLIFLHFYITVAADQMTPCNVKGIFLCALWCDCIN